MSLLTLALTLALSLSLSLTPHPLPSPSPSVSWGLASTLRDLIERLEQYVDEKGLDADTTFFWVCDMCIRQSGGKEK